MKLDDLASKALAAVRCGPIEPQRLSNGLWLGLAFTDGGYTLDLWRLGSVSVGAEEVKTCRRAFHIPTDADETWNDGACTLTWVHHLGPMLPVPRLLRGVQGTPICVPAQLRPAVDEDDSWIALQRFWYHRALDDGNVGEAARIRGLLHDRGVGV